MDENIQEAILSEVQCQQRNLLTKLDKLNLKFILKKMNPYMQCCITSMPEHAIKNAIESHIWSSQESIIGNLLEKIAIRICGADKKSPSTGVDLDITIGRHRILISLKSGKNWGNSSSHKGQKIDFEKAKRTVKANIPSNINVISILAYFYGNNKTSESKTADYIVSGQLAWYLIANKDVNMYKKVLNLIRQQTEKFEKELLIKKQETFDRIIKEFNQVYSADGNPWERLLEEICENYSPEDMLLKRIIG